jgi:hypothetical protein
MDKITRIPIIGWIYAAIHRGMPEISILINAPNFQLVPKKENVTQFIPL